MKRSSDSIYQGARDSLEDLDGPHKPDDLQNDAPHLQDDMFYKEYRASQRKTVFVIVGFFLLIILAFVVMIQQSQLKKRPSLSQDDTEPQPELDYVRPSGFNFNSSSDSPIFVVEDLFDTQPEEIPEGEEIPFNSKWLKQAAFHVARGEAMFREHNYSKALVHYETAIQIFPELYDVYKFIGLIHLKKKRYDEAIAAFEVASKNEPLNHGLLNNLGVAELARENMEKAAEYFERSLTLTTGYPLAHYNLASLYYRMEEYEKSVAFFESYEELDNSNMEAAQMHANALIRLERWEDSATLLKSIVDRAPDVAPVYFRLSQTLAMAGDLEDALRALERGINLVDAKKALSWMSRNEFDILRQEPKFQQWVQDLGKSR